MATIVSFEGIQKDVLTLHIFRTNNKFLENLCVKSFENGIATVYPRLNCPLDSLIATVVGCFDKESNFARELLLAYNADMDTVFKGIQFNFSGVTLLVTEKNANKDKILKEWQEGMETIIEEHNREREAYMKTPDYRAKRAKKLKAEVRRKTVQKEVLFVDTSTELQFKNEQGKKQWEKFVLSNSTLSAGIITVAFARRWAKYMQYLMKKHNKSVMQIAEQASLVSGTEFTSGFTYACAVYILTETWKYGDELRKMMAKKRI